ncbi:MULTISPECIES: iron-siderophore ABC transporter substrate-binding protein [Lysinibacillus]|jgi:iron complex transport system substrate-binding protein|uniref:Iron-siderophore ABC transporter substrate-binding protein n=1 Tax=Lysinibacillus fusiformis TaxID=28031 RepID=A0A2I0V428_9BACI|nr:MULTISPECIES: iron-siderophore ABC transporter substrate-binding protein [Lysinibacillus]KUF36700.1 iron ABC transporter permease [Lysinibacillus sp. F5]MEE3807253.1 iron-siderophore ABC transporter substrate-binding protein [Lysinibacillus fusiformis]PKU53064.1 iron-siderophore ABC transporter substrate-binding protein [Lysinibacillus fusiformis]WCH48985.1 iron-siderophore ABC transporter substrate-binding protein [Lysinibacillus sp. OF-1]SCX92647.1 iron complex transport system substrate-
MSKIKNSMFIVMLLSLMVLALAACSDSSNKDTAKKEEQTKDNTSETTDEQQYPITIKHAFGETVIEKKPERVATIAWSNHDVALSLGVVPVGFSAANYGVQDGSGMLPWTAEKLKELGEENPNIYQDTDGLDFEAIADSNPDVILAAYSGITQEEYETLSQIAPVVAYKETPWVTSWRDQVTLNAQGMGMEAQGQQLIKDTEKLIQDKVNEHAAIKGKKAAFAMFTPTDLSKFYVYTPADPRGEFLMELGMEYPESVTKQISDDSSFYIELSAENADALADVEIFIAYGDETTLPALQADPILGKVPAIQNGNVVVIGDNTPLAAAGTPSPLSIAYTIDDYLSLISDVAKNIK